MRERGNFFISSRVLLWSCATFIMLSVAASERQCYWCGPLAEQVHRSRRAPPCDVPTAHVTMCEAGLMHCAVVATSPPHVESRFCVKLYQDECYPLFCNSTRTWKMTCPCRGNLCNGNNTEREIEAFAVLSKLVTKSQNIRIKKRSSEESNLIANDRQRTIIITNITQLQLNTTNHEVNESGYSEKIIEVTSTVHQDSISVTPSTENPTAKTLKESLSTKTPDENDQKLEQLNHGTDSTTSQDIAIVSNENPTTVIPNSDINVISNLSTIPDRTDTNEMVETTKGSDIFEETESGENEIVKKSETTKAANIDELTKENNTEKHLSNIPKPLVVPSEQLPTAEALQQNASPSPTSSKPTEVVKVASTDPSTVETENSTTVQPTKGSASYIGRLPAYIYTILFGLLLISH